MKYFITYLLFLVVSVSAVAQVDVTGKVVDKEDNTPLTGASVIVKGPDGKIKKYTTTRTGGSFVMSVPAVKGCRLEVSMISFVRQSISLDSVSFPLTVLLEPGTTLLKEVTVKADRIREQGDTITYGVSAFAQQQDRTIGDVLKRMPGINVASSGKIQYQGEDINKFYIEGSDLLGGRYGIATNGISHEDVGAVEVMENHQPMQVLSGISFSDKAAINLRLKQKAKATWSIHGEAGGGYSWQPEGAIWSGELFAMAVMSNFQNITTFKTNNTGDDLSAQATDFFATRRGTDLNRYVGVSLPVVPGLSQKRTLFNRSALVSTNALWKLGRCELKAQIDYSFNRVTAEAANITTYFFNDGNRVVTENRSGVDRSHSLSGKFLYEQNQKTAFINNTLKTDIVWDDVRLGVTGSLSNNQLGELPDYYVGNDFKLIKRFRGNHLVTFLSKNEWESMPQTLSVSAEDIFMRQHIRDHAFHTHESAAYSFSVKGFTVSLEGGVKGCMRTMRSDFNGGDFWNGDGAGDLLEHGVNVVNTDWFAIYAMPKFEYWIRRVNLTFNAPVSFAHYTFDKALANRSEVYFSPSFGLNWKPNNRFSVNTRAGIGRSPMDLSLIHPGFVMTSYRSFCRGVDDFYNSTSQNVSANFSYKHTRRGVFANAVVMQSWSHLPYTMAQQLYGDFVVYTYSSARSDGQIFTASGNIGKTLDFMRGSANINGSFCRQESHLISLGKSGGTMAGSQSVSSVGTSWSAGLRINGSPLRWISIDYRFDYSSSRLSINGTGASWLGNMENELLINIMPRRRWEWRIIGEHYRNELTAGNFKDVFLLDTKIIYKLDKRLEISAVLSNIFDRRTYSYTTYSQLSSFESQRWLRGREMFVSISLRK